MKRSGCCCLPEPSWDLMIFLDRTFSLVKHWDQDCKIHQEESWTARQLTSCSNGWEGLGKKISCSRSTNCRNGTPETKGLRGPGGIDLTEELLSISLVPMSSASGVMCLQAPHCWGPCSIALFLPMQRLEQANGVGCRWVEDENQGLRLRFSLKLIHWYICFYHFRIISCSPTHSTGIFGCILDISRPCWLRALRCFEHPQANITDHAILFCGVAGKTRPFFLRLHGVSHIFGFIRCHFKFYCWHGGCLKWGYP